jgi:fumarate hydratase class I
MWHLEADGFVAIVTMDSHGNSLHADVEKTTASCSKHYESDSLER